MAMRHCRRARPARLRPALRPAQARLGPGAGRRRRPPGRRGGSAEHRVERPPGRPDHRRAGVRGPVRRSDGHGRLFGQPRPRPPGRRRREGHRLARRGPRSGCAGRRRHRGDRGLVGDGLRLVGGACRPCGSWRTTWPRRAGRGPAVGCGPTTALRRARCHGPARSTTATRSSRGCSSSTIPTSSSAATSTRRPSSPMAAGSSSGARRGSSTAVPSRVRCPPTRSSISTGARPAGGRQRAPVTRRSATVPGTAISSRGTGRNRVRCPEAGAAASRPRTESIIVRWPSAPAY